MKRILCIWFPNWPIQRLLRSEPPLAEGPLVLYHARHGALRVVAGNRQAHDQGVQPGIPLAEAQALLRRASEDRQPPRSADAPAALLQVREYDPHADREALRELAAWSEQFSPLVGCEEGEEPSSLLADITGLAGLFGGEEQLVLRAAQELERLQLRARLAVGDSLGAAWALAHYDPRAGEKPLLVPAGQTAAALAALPATALRLEQKTLDLLARLGLVQIGQLMALPRGSLRCRFGPALLTRLDQALGRAEEVILAERPPQEFSAAWMLEHSTAHRETLEFVLDRLIERIAASLAQRGYGAAQLECRFDGERGTLARFQVGLFRPTATAAHLQELARMQMERLRLPQPVATVVVQAARSGPLLLRQQMLFAGVEPQQDPDQLGLLVNRLVGRLGRQAVVRPLLRGEAQPELAWQGVALIDRPARRRSGSSASTTKLRSLGPLARPLFLGRFQPLTDVQLAAAGTPASFCRGGDHFVVARCWGPERIETGWWRKRSVQRDYYRIETPAGRRLWIFRRLRDGRWFWHGDFA